LIATGVGIFGFIISCVFAKFVFKVGVPKHRPWEKNSEFYMDEDGTSSRNGVE
jgi:hypothetical protein